MTDAERRIYPASKWLEKMDHDLETIRLLRNVEEAPKDIQCFHAQQAVEKGLKAILAAHGIEPEHTHDLVALWGEVISFGVHLQDEKAALADLNEYAVGVRYPMHFPDPSPDEARVAAETARRVCEVSRLFVLAVLESQKGK